MDMTVKLQVFEGPLDLLLHLLDKNKVNIYDIPIVEITKQYMDYIREMKRHDLNVVSEFLVMAARPKSRTGTAAFRVQDVQMYLL